MEIIPYQRIAELEYFYTSDSVKNENAIEVVDIKSKKKFSEEVQGQWALEQVEAVMNILRVKMFVIPIDRGGYEFPVIAPIEEYLEAHLKAKEKAIDNFKSSQEDRQIYVQALHKKMQAAKGRRQTILESKEELMVDDIMENDEEAANEEFMRAYQKWSKEDKMYNDDMIKNEEIKENCRIQANKQHDDDTDAFNRLQSALFTLKKYIKGLIDKFPFLEDIVRQKRKDGIDPYDAGDMRSSYWNLLDRYRQNDEMGILTTIMSGMAEKQGSKSMSTFLLAVEDWHQTMIRLGVNNISMSDLAAIITLKGMNENHRIEFLQQENALALTLETLGTGDEPEEFEDVNSENQSMVSMHKREKKSLFSRVKKFIQQDKTKALINQRLSSSGSGAGYSSATVNNGSKTNKEAEAQLKEAQNVFIATLDSGICRNYAKFGNCKYGDKCKYKHESTVMNNKRKKVEGQNVKDGDKKSSHECFSWRDHGTCKHGDKCRFQHPDKKERNNVNVNSIQPSNESAKEKNKKPESEAAKNLFTIDDNSRSWGNNNSDNEDVSCILADANGMDKQDQETVLHVKEGATSDCKIGWDTMASIHVAGDSSVIDKLRPLHEKKSASGMGGTLPITHQGYSSKFGLNMHVIEGGKTPNIKSVGKSLEPDEDGTEYIAIFTHKGATQMSVTPQTKNALIDIINNASEDNRIVGTAVQQNGVYFEDRSSNSGKVDVKTSVTPEAQAYAIASMYTQRVSFNTADEIIGMLASACVKEEHLIQGIRHQSIKGLPECVTEDAVRKYFMLNGKDKDQLSAEIASHPLRKPIDYEPEEYIVPGEHLQIDNVDPSFARVPPKSRDKKSEESEKREPVRSIGGYRDAVVALDNCGYSVVIGRVHKRDPHLIVKRFMARWVARWQSLRNVTADKEFVTLETDRICKANNIRLRQAVPGDHRRGLGPSEGLNRWLQDAAQTHMNRLSVYVKSGEMTEKDKRSLWFHALTYANDVKLLAPSSCDSSKTQYEEGEGVPFNFSQNVLLPFGLRVISRKTLPDQDGRGLDGIYVGYSKVVTSGILVYMFDTKRVVQKYTFIPRSPMPMLNDIDVAHATSQLYGDLNLQVNSQTSAEQIVPWDIRTANDYALKEPLVSMEPIDNQENSDNTAMNSDMDVQNDVKDSTDINSIDSNQDQDSTETAVADRSNPTENNNSPQSSGVGPINQKDNAPQSVKQHRVTNQFIPGQWTDHSKDHQYATRSRAKNMERVLIVSSERPPKPKLPTRREARKDPRWRAAYQREVQKLREENTMETLPKDSLGRFIRPSNAIVMKLLAVLEWKWKPDPDTQREGWLECVRIVCDGSVDKREGENSYAETLDRTLLFLMTSIECTLGIPNTCGDAVRAYLNAPSLDNNLVVIADDDMIGLGRESLLIKALYGSTKGALSWQVWVDSKLRDIDYQKCDIARGVYMKIIKDPDKSRIVRLYRHSDDFRLSVSNPTDMENEISCITSTIRTSAFISTQRFLGCHFKRVQSTTMQESAVGDICLITMSDKIDQLEKDFGYLRKQYNPTGRIRYTPLPLKPILDDQELTDVQKIPCDDKEIKVYMSLIGGTGWITGNIRPNLKFAHHVLAKRLQRPRVWEMYMATWFMEHIIFTKDWPLILGGPEVDPVVYCDASFASMEERKSITGHCMCTCSNSGAIYSNVCTIKSAVKSIFEAETHGASDGQDTAIHTRNVIRELKYPNIDSRKVFVDNAAAIDWMLGSIPSKRSKHMEVRLYRARHLVDSGEVVMKHIPTENNIADLFTKSLPRKQYEYLAKKTLGHELVIQEHRSWERNVITTKDE